MSGGGALDPGGLGGTTAPTGDRNPAGAAAERLFMVRARQPSFRVALYSHDTGDALSDLYGLDADILTVQTNKTIRDPAGTWSLTTTIARKPVRGRGATWADIVTPMDYVEIAMRAYAADDYIVVMRGFVDNVRYVDAVSPGDGIPRRRVVINGRDFGKIWLEFKIFYLLELKQAPIDGATTMRYWGIAPKNWRPTEFLTEIYDKLVVPKIQKLQAKNRAIQVPTLQCSIPDKYRVNGFETSFQTFQGPLYNLMAQYATAPYTEFLIRDLPGAGNAATEWRWAPLLVRGNRLALDGSHARMPPVAIVHTSEIYNYSVATSDNDRYTYYWARPSAFTGTDTSVISKVTNPGYIDGAGIDLYGYKSFEPVFSLYWWAADANRATAPSQTRDQWAPQLQELTQWLVDTMIWAVEQFEGDIQGPLRADIVAGDFVDVPEENRRLYVEGVSHAFTAGQHPTTVLTVTRGLTLDDPTVPTPPGYNPRTATPGTIPGGSQIVGPPPPDPDAPKAPAGQGAERPLGPPPAASGMAGVLKVADDIIAQGTPYVLAGRAYQAGVAANDYQMMLRDLLKYGCDCSEFTTACYFFGAGLSLQPNAQLQYNATYRVGMDELVPGDLCLFKDTVSAAENNYDLISHVGIYVGNGRMANASSETIGVVYADITSGYWLAHWESGGRLQARNPGGPAGGSGQYNP